MGGPVLLDEGVNLVLDLGFSDGKSVVSGPCLNGLGESVGVLDLCSVVRRLAMKGGKLVKVGRQGEIRKRCGNVAIFGGDVLMFLKPCVALACGGLGETECGEPLL